jgi:hypothetical protein
MCILLVFLTYVYHDARFSKCKALYVAVTTSSPIYALKVHMIVSICRLYNEQPYLRTLVFLN